MKPIKLLALILAAVMTALTLCSCLGEGSSSDIDYVKGKEKLVIGMTEYVPMNYRDENGEWTGFDTEFAQLVAEKLGVKVEFIEIDWDNKWFALESKDIDCVWNGMTLTDEAKENASCTNTYVINAQVVVTTDKNAEKFVDVKSLEGANIAVEVGSAGAEVAEAEGLEYTEYPYQSDALMAVEAGKADACIIDITMANAMTGKGTSYENLAKTFSLNEEEYAIACRKGSDLTEKINEIMAELIEDGTLGKLAEKYEVTLVADKK